MQSGMTSIALLNQPTFPPDAHGSAWSYGLALFSNFLVVALSAAHLMSLLLDARRKRRAVRLFENGFTGPRLALFSPLNIFRGIVIGFLLTIVLRALPDVLWMLAWNEATIESFRWLKVAESVCDMLALFPLMVSLSLLVWSGQVIPQKLIQAGSLKLARPQLEDARTFLRLIVIILVMTIGVTVGKAYG